MNVTYQAEEVKTSEDYYSNSEFNSDSGQTDFSLTIEESYREDLNRIESRIDKTLSQIEAGESLPKNADFQKLLRIAVDSRSSDEDIQMWANKISKDVSAAVD